MLNEFLESQGTLYTAGVMTQAEREQFELVLEFHHELRAFVADLAGVAAAVTLSTQRSTGFAPSPGIRGRLAELISNRPQQVTPEGLVVSGPDRMVQWVNPSFSAMCGYSLEELSGKNLGLILQGEKTDRATSERMRRAVHEYRPCRETILNYHKNGTPYWVDVSITPIRDDAGNLLWLIARENELKDRVAA
ncbi:MAG: PAS domain-containing protein [Chthoniobacteraceae bacterium]